jgi:hypothetical protein
MEDQRAVDRAIHEAWRRVRGWPPIPESMLAAAESIVTDAEAAGTNFTFCDVPIQHLTEREARAGLAFLMREHFVVKGLKADASTEALTVRE